MIDMECKECGGNMAYCDEYEEEVTNELDGSYHHMQITVYMCGDCGWTNEEVRNLNTEEAK